MIRIEEHHDDEHDDDEFKFNSFNHTLPFVRTEP